MKTRGHMKFARKTRLFCLPAAGARFACADTTSSRTKAPESKSELPEQALDLCAFIASKVSSRRKRNHPLAWPEGAP